MASDVTLRLLLTGKDVSASKSLQGVGREAGQAQGKMDKLKKVGAVAGAAVAAGLVTAGLAAIEFGGQAIDAASRGEQAIGGVGAVFKKNADEIEKAAAGAAKGLGLSKNSYRELATVLGAGLKNKGIKDYTDQTQTLITTGADLAAQFGGSTQEAVEALASALRGESDPVEKYGVSLNEAAISAELAAQGQTKLKGAALEQAKTQARLAIITRQTADAQGAFGREADTTAGKQARMQASYENLQETIGYALLPAVQGLTDAGQGLMDWIDQNPEAIAGAQAAWELFMGVLSGIWEVVRKYVAPALGWLLEGQARLARGTADMLDALGEIPGFEWAKDAATKVRGIADGIDAVAGGLKALANDPPPKVEVDDKATAEVAKITTKIKALKDKLVVARAKGDSKEVDRLKGKIDKLRDKRVNINAHVRKTGVTTIRPINVGGGLKISAYDKGGRPKVGELAYFHADELWVPDTAGTVLTKSRTQQLMGDGPSVISGADRRGGDTTLYASFAGRAAPPREFARFIESELYALLKSRGKGGRLRFQGR